MKRGREQRELDLDMENLRLALEHVMSERLTLDADIAYKESWLFTIVTDYAGLVKSSSPDVKMYAAEMLTSGFFANITHILDLTPPIALDLYDYRDELEKYLSTMKTQMI